MGIKKKWITWTVIIAWFLLAFSAWAAQPSPSAMDPKVSQAIKDGSKPPVVLPDLTIDYINLIPANPKLEENLTIQFAIKNIGSAASTASHAALYSKGYGNALNIPGGVAIQPLAPGQSQVFTYSGVLKAQQYNIVTGKHDFGIDLNLQKNPVESNYLNNYKDPTFYIYPAGGASTQPLPDLTITVLTLNPPDPVSGGSAVVTLTVANSGPGPSGPTKAFFSGSSSLCQALGLPVTPTTIPVPALNPGQSDTFTFSAPGGKLNLAPGSYTLAALVNNATGAVPETNTGNNTKTLNFTVQLPKIGIMPKTPAELKPKP
jgi:subtilase family serine protease